MRIFLKYQFIVTLTPRIHFLPVWVKCNEVGAENVSAMYEQTHYGEFLIFNIGIFKRRIEFESREKSYHYKGEQPPMNVSNRVGDDHIVDLDTGD